MAVADGSAGGAWKEKVEVEEFVFYFGLVVFHCRDTRNIELGDTPFSFIDRLVGGGYILIDIARRAMQGR